MPRPRLAALALAIIGLASLVAGAWIVAPAAAFIVAGIGMLYIAWRIEAA